jgi:adenylosuccinate synthase
VAKEIAVVVDLGFGDGGKGTVTDHLVRRRGARTVVRFNGGAQAGHNVVTSDGRHHTFAQFGAGSFVPGVRTHLSRYVVVHPTALLVEARHLASVGVGDALDRVTVAGRALVTTPVHQAAARIRELALGAARHGSCGVGVGETMRDAIDAEDDAIRAHHLGDAAALRRAAVRHQTRKRAELDTEVRALARVVEAASEIRALEDATVVDAWIDALAPMRARSMIVDDEHLAAVLRAPDAVVFEGAQGVLLDEWRGFHPYTTWSTCTFDNALALVRELGDGAPVTRVGVLRTYATRHGPGPFPTESRDVGFAEPHNVDGPWQGAFRVGWLDAVLARYAIEACGGVDGIAVTHVDALARMPRWRICRRYRDGTPVRLGTIGDLEHTAALARALTDVDPIYEDVTLSGDLAERTERVIARVGEALGASVILTSSGPTAADKADRR